MFSNMCFFPYGLLYKTKRETKVKSLIELSTRFRNLCEEFEDFSDNSINEVNAASTLVPFVGQISTNNTNTFSAASPSNTVDSPIHGKSSYLDTSQYPDDLNMPALEDITYSDDEEDIGADTDFTNLETTITVNPIPITRVHKDHSVTQIIGDLSSATHTRSMTRMAKDQGGLTQINNEYFHTCMFPCFLSQEEPKRDERGIVIRNKARLVTQGHTQEEGIDYKEVFAPVARIEAIRLFLAYASFMGFMVFQMDVKSAFLYGTIKKEFGLTDGKSASTPIDTEKPLLKDPDGKDVDVHTYSNEALAIPGQKATGHKVSVVGVSYIYFDGYCEPFTFTYSRILPLIIQNPNFNFSLFIILIIIMALTFADTHNMIAFLTKSDASEGFKQIIDFLNAHVI
nr:hypothetical protein [Tanacetum cinerariifolium]